ncbi:glycosyltransferase [Candidatus Sumerlaeota bacterium]|nr:glycosyltransferase [Candidatus Sumerlaeota bacterium]
MTPQQPTVSFIIPVYNGAEWIADAIRSILDAKPRDFQIIIIDDGSTDNVREVVDRFVDGDSCRYKHQANRGLSAARNAGLDVASGRHVLFLDADDLLIAGDLNSQIDWLEANPDYDIVTANGLRFSDNVGSPIRLIEHPPGEVPLSRVVVSNPFPIHALLFRRELFDGGLRFEESLNGAEDWDLLARAMIDGARVMHRNAWLAAYRTLPVSMSTNSDRQINALLTVIDRIHDNPKLPENLRALEARAIADAASHGVAKACTEGNPQGSRQWMAIFLAMEDGDDAWRSLLPRIVAAERNPRMSSREQYIDTFLQSLPEFVDRKEAGELVHAALLTDDVSRAREFGNKPGVLASLAKLLSSHPRHALRHYKKEVRKRLG